MTVATAARKAAMTFFLQRHKEYFWRRYQLPDGTVVWFDLTGEYKGVCPDQTGEFQPVPPELVDQIKEVNV